MEGATFSELYIHVRASEKRIYSDDQLKLLPETDNNTPHHEEWKVRKASFLSFKKYLLSKRKSFRVLDVGCGNGWMTNRLSGINHSRVTGIDVNSLEIEQAKRVFKENDKINFISRHPIDYLSSAKEKFEIIVIAAALQYFPDSKILVGNLLPHLASDGEIHIIDSPFYKESTIDKAKERTRNYYTSMGFPEMIPFYHHHTFSELEGFNFKIMNRSFVEKVLLKFSGKSKNYFPWIMIRK